MDDPDSSSSDEEGTGAEEANIENVKDSPMAGPEDPSAPPIPQKRTHETSSSDSDKESPPSAQNILQLVLVLPSHNDWIKVTKKKVKKCRLEVSTNSG